jgi:hypothetical protein
MSMVRCWSTRIQAFSLLALLGGFAIRQPVSFVSVRMIATPIQVAGIARPRFVYLSYGGAEDLSAYDDNESQLQGEFAGTRVSGWSASSEWIIREWFDLLVRPASRPQLPVQ